MFVVVFPSDEKFTFFRVWMYFICYFCEIISLGSLCIVGCPDYQLENLEISLYFLL
jgi:hypothetical protein